MSCTYNALGPTMKLGTPAMGLGKTYSLSQFLVVRVSALCTSPTQAHQNHKFSRLVCCSPKNKSCAPICLFGGKRNSGGDKKAFSWDSLKDAVEGWRNKNVVQDNLKDQMRQREFGGGDGNPPRNPGGGGGSDGTEDEGFASTLDEIVQVALATIAFILVYIYIIRGAELFKLARDYFKYLLGGVPSMRLQQVMDKWNKTWGSISYVEESDDWLERLIVTTPTWWHRPDEIVRAVKSRVRRDDQEN